jgi:hypothetical protein
MGTRSSTAYQDGDYGWRNVQYLERLLGERRYGIKNNDFLIGKIRVRDSLG